MSTKTKIHPHLKSFIHSVVMAEMTLPGQTKRSVQWKENLMRQVQSNVLERIDEVQSQADLEKITLEEVKKFKEDFVGILELIGQTLKQVPVEVLKQQRA
jgi:hypothetical protein